jgi:hypothetical protein
VSLTINAGLPVRHVRVSAVPGALVCVIVLDQ